MSATMIIAAPPGATKVFTLTPSTHGNPEGIAADPGSDTFYVGATGDGTIYRGTLDNPNVTVFIPGGPGLEAAGMKVFKGKLYVAGGFSGAVRVYDLSTKQIVASFQPGGAGMLNDVVVTEKGDLFITDSFIPVLWHITAAQVAAGGGTAAAIPVAPEIPWDFAPFSFNLNGIVSQKGGKELIVVQTNTKKLFRIDLDDRAPNGREIHQIDVAPLDGDGLLIDRGQLLVVQLDSVAFVKLDGKDERGTVVELRVEPKMRESSTIARAKNYYLVVNADFGTSTLPFTVIGIPRNGDDDQ